VIYIYNSSIFTCTWRSLVIQENYTKISKIKQLEAIGARRATMGHLVGLTDPTMPPVDVAQPEPPHQSVGSGQKHTSKPSPPLIQSRFKMKDRKEASHWLLTHHAVCRCSNGQHMSIPTLYYTPQGPTPKDKGPLVSRGPADALSCCLECHFHSIAFPSDTCKETHLGLGSNPIHWFKVVQGQFDPKARRWCHMDRWCGIGVAPTPPSTINRTPLPHL
jgi:hypothetical protein